MNLLKLSEEEKLILKITFNNIMKKLSDNYKKMYNRNKIDYDIKKDGKNKGQWGYYITNNLYELMYELQKNNINSLFDLGAGVGHLVLLLNSFGINAKGIEIEEELVNRSKLLINNITQNDIFNLTQNDMNKDESLYFWDPFYDKVLIEKFVKHLENIMIKDQLIVFQNVKISKYLLNSKSFKLISTDDNELPSIYVMRKL